MHSRSSFYPLPPSSYPKPLLNPGPAQETTYGHYHGYKSVRDEDFYRTRTLNPLTIRAQTAPTELIQPTVDPLTYQSVYPKHGIGNFTLPYYRRDSKGFRKPFTQPVHVDENYLREKDHSRTQRLVGTGLQWAHPSSKLTHTQRINTTGTTFQTSYRNSGLYDCDNTAHTSRVPEYIANGFDSDYPSATQIRPMTIDEQYQRDKFIQSQIDADETLKQTKLTQRNILADPLLADPIANAYRKSRTVYKRSYGYCQ